MIGTHNGREYLSTIAITTAKMKMDTARAGNAACEVVAQLQIAEWLDSIHLSQVKNNRRNPH